MWIGFGAKRYLHRLADQVGEPGRAGAAMTPGVLAELDQHAAAVRDIIAAGQAAALPVAGSVMLAGYARCLVDEAEELGWTVEVPEDPAGWTRAEWLTMRLAAVCTLDR